MTGEAEFGIDFEVEGMLRATIIHPQVIGQDVVDFDASEARAMRGIVDIFAFERGVAIVAEKYWQARRAVPKIDVTWSTSPLESFSTADLREAARDVDRKTSANLRDDGKVDRAIERADQVVEASYEAPYPRAFAARTTERYRLGARRPRRHLGPGPVAICSSG